MGSYGDNKVFSTIGASNHSSSERALHDYYATDPIAVEKPWITIRGKCAENEPCEEVITKDSMGECYGSL